MNKIERILAEKIDGVVGGDLKAYTPGLCIQVVHRGKLKIDLKMGRTWRYYDLASLTKIIFATPAIMQLAQTKTIDVSAPVARYLPDWPHRKVKVNGVLSHSAGLSWWAPFYKKLKNKKFKSEADKRAFIKKILYSLPLQPQKKAIYSDLDFILLGFVIEKCLDQTLLEVWQNMKWPSRSLHFCPGNEPKYARKLYAPTEKCPWRKKVLQGEVHDDNTYAFGGVSTHAGLFGTVDDVTAYGQILRQSYRGLTKKEFAKSTIVRKFVKRAVPKSRGDFALGFFMPTKGSASCGRYFSPESFGHTGFTGTSFWYDPIKDLQVVILSNRVYPTRNNRKFVKLRPILHDLVVEALGL